MKTNRCLMLIIAVLGLAAFSTAGSAKDEKIASAVSPPTMAMVIITVTDARPGPVARLQFTAAASSEVASARWSEIKDCTYDMRAQFFAGLNRLEARVDAEVAVLTAQRAAMKSTANTKGKGYNGIYINPHKHSRIGIKRNRAHGSAKFCFLYDISQNNHEHNRYKENHQLLAVNNKRPHMINIIS